MTALDPTRDRRRMTRRAGALGLAVALFVTLALGGLRPEASAQDAGKEAPSRKTESQMLAKAQLAIREERFDDAYRLASELLEADPADDLAAAIRDRAVTGQLKQRGTLDFARTPVKEAIAYLARASRIDMIVDPDAEEDKLAKITLKVEDMPLENALDIILRKFAKLDYSTLDGRIYISDEQGLTVYAILKYDVRDLLADPEERARDGDAGADARAAGLVRLVTTFIWPKSWRHAAVSRDGRGGDVRVEVPAEHEGLGGGIVFREGHLIVRQAQPVHREVANFLALLRQHRRGPVASTASPRLNEASRATTKEARLSAQAWRAILEERFDDAYRIAAQILQIDSRDALAQIIQNRAADERPADKVSQFRQHVRSKQRLCLERPLRRKAPPLGRPTPRDSGVVRDTPGAAEIKEKLGQEITMRLEDHPVADIIAFLHDAGGINMMLDPDALDVMPTISVKAEGTRLRTLLHVILRHAHLDYVVRDDGLFISSEEGLSEFVLRTYDARDIVARTTQEWRAVDLLALVITVVGPGSWQHAFVSGAHGEGDLKIRLPNGGEDAVAAIAFRAGDLIVWQTPRMHAEIEGLLERLDGGPGRGAAYAFLALDPTLERSLHGPPLNGVTFIDFDTQKWQLWATPGHNLLANAGFEDGDSLPTHWDPFDYSNRILSCRDTQVKRTGAASLRLSRGKGRFAPIDHVSQDVRSVLPGGKLSVSAYVRAQGVETALIDLAFLNNVGECIEHERVGDLIRGTHDWRKYGGTFTVPTNATDARVLLETNAAGTVWFDDLAASSTE